MRYSVFGAALAGAMMLASHPVFAEPSPATAAPAAAVTQAAAPQVADLYTRSKLFDMKQCYDDGRGCQLATCVSQLTPAGPITICQSHGTNFP
jgi:hypothetical protein